MKTIPARDAKDALTKNGEIALIDIREAGQYGEGHAFFAVNIPYSRLEAEVGLKIPRPTTPIVLLDDDDGLAERAERRLRGMGYTDIRKVDGGMAGWTKAGFSIFKGVSVPSKAFGEMVEHAMHTPSISAEELKRRRAAGEKLLILDGRTPDEFSTMNIPGGRSCPNQELALRLPALDADPDTTVVVNCAGRTRSIIGAQTLLSVGIANPVIALENGTQGWALAGFELERGTQAAPLPAIDEAARAAAKDRAVRLREAASIPEIDSVTLAAWSADPNRTTYLFDVRTAEEYAAGHLRGAVHAPGGQLQQTTDHWIAVRNARIVLYDDTGLRATTTAMWLRGMGHEAAVLNSGMAMTETAPPTPAQDFRPPDLPLLAAREVPDALSAGAVIVDVSPSQAYRKGHIHSAVWGIRPRLADLGLGADTEVLLAARDDATAALAAIELQDAGLRKILRIPGGPKEWQAAGLEVVETPDHPDDSDCIDYLFFVHDRHTGNLDAARAYLSWETGLIAQMDEDEKAVMNPTVPVLEPA